MKKGVGLEVKRQLIHLIVGVCIAFAVYMLKPIYGPYTAVPIFLGILVFKLLPRIGKLLHIHSHFMNRYEREEDVEKTPYKGAINYGLGILPAIVLLNRDFAAAVIMVLSVGDSISTIVGVTIGYTAVKLEYVNSLMDVKSGRLQRFLSVAGRTSEGYKTLEGFVGFMLSAFIGGLIFVGIPEAFFLASLGAFIELLLPFDDNLSIPWILSVAGWLFLQ